MRKYAYRLAVLALPLLLGCGGKSASVQEDAAETVQAADTVGAKPLADEEWTSETEENIAGHAYRVSLKRVADKTLPAVPDEDGNDYADNRVEMSIERDGKPFFHKAFTKEAFLDFLSPADRKSLMLQGIAFDRGGAEGLRFGAQLGLPRSDDGVFFAVTVGLDGTVHITKDYVMDTAGDGPAGQ